MKTYTVVGVVGIDNERYGTCVEAEDSHDAELIACQEVLEGNGDNLLVAAVIEGKVKIVG
jgi:hypothetical protein